MSKRASTYYREDAEDDDGVVSLDANLEDSDWIKSGRLGWNLPPYKSPEFMLVVKDLDAFRRSPVYHSAVDLGLIVDDEWAGDNPQFDQEPV